MQSNTILYQNAYRSIEFIKPEYPIMISKQRGVVVIPHDNRGNIYAILIQRDKIGTHLELPRGFVEFNEDFLTGAKRELFEETGLTAFKATDLGPLQPDTGALIADIHAIAIKVPFTETRDHYDAHDNMTVKVQRLTLDDITNLVVTNKIVCSLTMSALLKMLLWSK